VVLPTQNSVNKLMSRMKTKGWIEYLFKGKGILKPFFRVAQVLEESSRTETPKKILDHFIPKK